MKTSKYIKLSLLCVVLGSFLACESLDDFEPLFSLPAETALTDEAAAELALAGVYQGFGPNNPFIDNAVYVLPSLLSGLASTGNPFFTSEELLALQANSPIALGATTTTREYTEMYDVVNRCNWLIQEVVEIPDSEFDNLNRKIEIEAEAKAARATANFYLLRLWGEFYDLNSSFGIDVRTTPAASDEAFPRKSVAETYEVILQDLDFAIANAPDSRAKYFINKPYASALKAKILLYQGRYAEAADLARDVINNSGPSFQLAAPFEAIFDNSNDALFSSNEVLFGTRGIVGEEATGISSAWRGFTAFPSDSYNAMLRTGTVSVNGQTIALDGGAMAELFVTEAELLGDPLRRFTGVFKYRIWFTTFGENWDMIYHMRMAEMYLIFAEANARATSSVTAEALDALNAVRIRRGAVTTGGDGFETYPATVSFTQFLELVRLEKMVELGAETGEEWFDLVRYHFVDGFDITTVKPTATDPDKYILPIPIESINVGGGIVEQNPGY